MTTAQLVALDLAAAILAAGSWAAASVVALGSKGKAVRRAVLALSLACVGSLALVADLIVVLALAGSGWWFVEEKVLLALPLGAVGVAAAGILAGPPLVRAARGSSESVPPRALAALVAAACTSLAGILARAVIGYPVSMLSAAALVLLVVLVIGLEYALLARRGRRLVVAISVVTALVVVASIGFPWLRSVATPASFASGHGSHAGQSADAPGAETTSVAELRTPDDGSEPDATFELTARMDTFQLDSGRKVSAWSFGSVPGPELRVSQGDLVEVTLRNTDVEEGVTLHWHGVDVPNGEDGVAGVTQDAVLPGESFTYRFVAEQAGSFWYHTHQSSADGVQRGLFGALVITPGAGNAEDVDITVPVHTLGRSVLLGNSDEETTHTVAEGETVRIRLINTDQVPRTFRLTGTAFQVVALDGTDLEGPTPVSDVALRIPAGGRMDVVFTMPASGVRLTSDSTSRAAVSFSTDGGAVDLRADRDAPELDLLSYGRPTSPQVPAGDRIIEATMVLDQLPRFLQGRPLQGYTVNGEVFPHIPNIVVQRGDVVVLTVANRNWETHPMHLHGHHVLVLSRNGKAATGSPVWLDTFDVQPGEVWEVAFVADNPGIWMDHCHNLTHAAEGMMMALHYAGVTSPFEQGGEHGNSAE